MNFEHIFQKLLNKDKQLKLPENTFFLINNETFKWKWSSLILLESQDQDKKNFSQFFSGKKAEQDYIISLPNIKPTPFLHLIQIYVRYTSIYDNIVLSRHYSISKYEDRMYELFSKNLNINNCIMIYDQYYQLHKIEKQNLNNLIEKQNFSNLKEFISLHANLVVLFDNFLKINPTTLKLFFESDSLLIKEKDLLYALLDWIDYNIKLEESKKSTIELSRIELKSKRKSNLKEYIHYIRLPKDELNKLIKEYYQMKDGVHVDGDHEDDYVIVKNNSKQRNDLFAFKLTYDENKKKVLTKNPFNDDDVKKNSAIDILLENRKKRENYMIEKYGIKYYEDSKKKRRVFKKNQTYQHLHMFRLTAIIDANKDDEPELYEYDTQKVEIKFEKFNFNGSCIYFEFSPSIPLTVNRPYRLVIRNTHNEIRSSSFIIKEIKGQGGSIEIDFQINDETDLFKIADLYLIYKKDCKCIQLIEEKKSSKSKKNNKSAQKVKVEVSIDERSDLETSSGNKATTSKSAISKATKSRATKSKATKSKATKSRATTKKATTKKSNAKKASTSKEATKIKATTSKAIEIDATDIDAADIDTTDIDTTDIDSATNRSKNSEKDKSGKNKRKAVNDNESSIKKKQKGQK